MSSSVESVLKKNSESNRKPIQKSKNKDIKPKELSESSKKFDLLSQIDSKRLSENSIKNKIVKKKRRNKSKGEIRFFRKKVHKK